MLTGPFRNRRGRWLALLTAPLLSVAVLAPAPAAADNGKVLILSTTVSGGTSSQEAQAVSALGLVPEVVSPAQWAAKSAADFDSYRALVLGDPNCGFGPAYTAAAVNNRGIWGPEVDGNVIVNGTDPVFHAGQGGLQVTRKGIAFAADVPGKTGMYISLSCYYHDTAPNTPVPLLDPFGAFAVSGVGCFNNAHIVATHPALLGLTDASLSNWSCSVHEAFRSWPASGPNSFTPLAIARNAPGGTYTAPDGSVGLPYILARGEGLSAGNIALAPATSTGDVGTLHTVTATVAADGSPLVGKTIGFEVVTGPHAGAAGTGTSNATGQATFSYTGTSAGTDSIRASFTDDLGTLQVSNTATREWTISNTPPTGSAGGPYSGTEGSAIAVAGSAADADADTLTYSWLQAAGGSFDAGAACTFADATALSTTVTCTDDGTFPLTLSISDGINPPVLESASLTVGNAAPTVDITAPNSAVVPIGSAVSLTSTFADAGTNDLPAMTCSVNWDDSPTASAVTPSGTDCNASHSYTAAGVYNIAVTADDQDGGTGSDTTMLVVYDPSAGFVTGGGWIDSPAGAYRADPALVGKANFGFVSKYQKGATTPTGNTEFQFHAGNFAFNSTSYDWLVVSGPRAQYKGTGLVNGVGDYGFLLTANDGAINGGGGADRFRMKVWDKASGLVVYDNQPADGDTAAATDAIEGGSIVIHAKK